MKYLRSSLTRTAGRWLLSLALSLVLTGSVRAVVWHAEPRTNWLGTNALVLIAQPSGTGYLTRTITWSNLVTGLASQDWVTASLTNSFWQTNFVFWTNYLGTTNFNFWTNYIATHAAANNTWTNTGTEIRTLTGLPVVVSNQLQGEYTGDGTNHGLAVLAPSAGGVGADLTLWSLADATAAFKGLDLSISPDAGPLLSGYSSPAGGPVETYFRLDTNGVSGIGGTMAGPLLSTSSSSEAPAGNEFITASYFRKSMANGVILYNTTNTLAGTNSQYSATIPAPFVRTYSSLTAGDYIGCTVATNLSSLLGPVVVSTWLAGVPTAQYNYRLLVTAETWWSTNNGATLEGQYGSDPAFINHSAANRHEFMVTVPPTIFTTPATLYVAIRIYQISNADLQVFGGTNTPSQISYNTGAGAYANITILNAGDVYTTNLYATNFYAGNTYTTNLYVTNLYALTHTIENVTISGGIAFVTNSWAGPTNTLTLQPGGLYDLNYASATPCAITGFTTSSGYRTAEALLSVANTAATNITVTLPAGVADGDYTLTHTITNGTTGMFWLRYTPVGPRTNCVFRQM